jgi:hypothetical protein
MKEEQTDQQVCSDESTHYLVTVDLSTANNGE